MGKGKFNSPTSSGGRKEVDKIAIRHIISNELAKARSDACNFATIAYYLMSLHVLNEKFNFDTEQLKEFVYYMNLSADVVFDDALSIQEIFDILKENGFKLSYEEIVGIDPSLSNYLEPEGK